MRPNRWAGGAALLALLTAVAVTMPPPSRSDVRQTSSVVRYWVPAKTSACNDSAAGLSYHYPIKPFDRQHPIRGNFGDPRTLTTEKFGEDNSRSPGSFTFHNGVDICAPTGTAVYPVASGIARVLSGDAVSVSTGMGRTFQYFHIKPYVSNGAAVTAYRTVLGTVRPEYKHVHLTEIDLYRVHNPAAPGHLEPYEDHTVPDILELRFSDVHGAPAETSRLAGEIAIAAHAEDFPPIPVPGAWFDYPVTPALVTWHIERDGKVVKGRTVVADFRSGEPPNRDFWHVYAAGTYQNWPVFAHAYFARHPGMYLFNLTGSRFLDTRVFPDGPLKITVEVADICGNRSGLTQTVVIANGASGT